MSQAFPVLCRILTELKLLSTPVGVITLSAGVSNDVVGWILLALCVALVNAGSGLTALWVSTLEYGNTAAFADSFRYCSPALDMLSSYSWQSDQLSFGLSAATVPYKMAHRSR